MEYTVAQREYLSKKQMTYEELSKKQQYYFNLIDSHHKWKKDKYDNEEYKNSKLALLTLKRLLTNGSVRNATLVKQREYLIKAVLKLNDEDKSRVMAYLLPA